MLEMKIPRVDFDEIRVTEAIAEQIKGMCEKSDKENPFGLKIATSRSLPEDGYVLISGGKVVAAGLFKNLV